MDLPTIADIQARLGTTDALLVLAAALPLLPLALRRTLSSLLAWAIVAGAAAVLYLGRESLTSAFLIMAAGAMLLSATSRHGYKLVRDLEQEQSAILARLRNLEIGEGRLQAILARKPFINLPREQQVNATPKGNGVRNTKATPLPEAKRLSRNSKAGTVTDS